MIGCVEFIGNLNNNENIEFGFEMILKNVTHWNFDNQRSEKNDEDLWELVLLINPININGIDLNWIKKCLKWCSGKK